MMGHRFEARRLRVRFLTLRLCTANIDNLERQLIQFLAPCLNTTRNHIPWGLFTELGKRSRGFAVTI